MLLLSHISVSSYYFVYVALKPYLCPYLLFLYMFGGSHISASSYYFCICLVEAISLPLPTTFEYVGLRPYHCLFLPFSSYCFCIYLVEAISLSLSTVFVYIWWKLYLCLFLLFLYMFDGSYSSASSYTEAISLPLPTIRDGDKFWKKKNSNLCGDIADFTPPPSYLGQNFMQSPVIDMCPSKVGCQNKVLTTAIHENRGFF